MVARRRKEYYQSEKPLKTPHINETQYNTLHLYKHLEYYGEKHTIDQSNQKKRS